MASLMPLQRSVTPWKVNRKWVVVMRSQCCLVLHISCVSVQTPPQIRPFSQDEFLSTLDHAGPQLTSLLRGDWIGLYRWASRVWVIQVFSVFLSLSFYFLFPSQEVLQVSKLWRLVPSPPPRDDTEARESPPGGHLRCGKLSERKCSTISQLCSP